VSDEPAPADRGNREMHDGATGRERTTFAVGRADRKTTEIQLSGDAESPIPGPWAVKAIVRAPGPRLRLEP